jgi:cytochrome c
MKATNGLVTASLTVAFSLLSACSRAAEPPTATDTPAATDTTAATDTAPTPQPPSESTDTQAASPAQGAESPPAAPTRTAEVAAPQGSSAGKLQFNNACRTCHSMRKGDNRLGPSLHGVLGRKAGASEGYAAYSQAMKGSDIVWDEATLDRFLANPEAVVPNNNMKPFAGVPDPAVRKRIIEHLKSAGDERS